MMSRRALTDVVTRILQPKLPMSVPTNFTKKIANVIASKSLELDNDRHKDDIVFILRFYISQFDHSSSRFKGIGAATDEIPDEIIYQMYSCALYEAERAGYKTGL